jgi:hypothetical protein
VSARGAWSSGSTCNRISQPHDRHCLQSASFARNIHDLRPSLVKRGPQPPQRNNAEAVKVAGDAVEAGGSIPVDARVAPAAPARRRYEVLTPSMISIASVASTLKATRDVVITWTWPVLAKLNGSYKTVFCVRTPTTTWLMSATMM